MSIIIMSDQSSIIFENHICDSLNIKSRLNKIFALFHRNFIDTNTPIGIMMERSPDLIIAMFAALCYGIPFLPIDSTLPSEYINFILSNSEIDLILTSNQSSALLVDKNTLIFNDSNINNFRFKLTNFKNEIAYLLYTSGSTGKPKGVEITRNSLFNFIDGVSEIIDFSPGKRIACLTTVSFDIFFLEGIIALYKGLTIVLANSDEQRNPRLMAKLIHDNNVDMIQMTPSRMQLLLNHDKELSCLKNIKEIMIGGEPFPLSLLRAFQEKTTAKIYNMYGLTETTIWSAISDLTNKDSIDIGRPIKNTEIYIVDKNLYMLPDGQAGEICIAGKGLAKGYVGRDDLTVERFVYLPQKPDVKVYRTGDIGKHLPNGNFEYLGRTDNQVKIRGHRIELEEIETHLNQFSGIKQVVVIALETGETDKVLQAFYTSENNIDSTDILNYLSEKLPSYMLPTIFKRVEDFIQTANGKIDRKRVLECIEIKINSSITQEATFDSMTDVQKMLLKIIASNLDSKVADSVSLDTVFSDVGVDSITFIKIIVALETKFDFEFDDEMLLITKFSTVRSMIEYVKSKTSTNCKVF